MVQSSASKNFTRNYRETSSKIKGLPYDVLVYLFIVIWELP